MVAPLQYADKFGPYGLRIMPTFDQMLDAAQRPLRIPLPDRAAKRKAFSFYRAALNDNLMTARGYVAPPDGSDPEAPGGMGARRILPEQKLAEVQRLAMAGDIAALEHALSGETHPASLLPLAPSPSADDAAFDVMQKHSQTHFENARQAAFRHKIDHEAQLQMSSERHSNLSDAYSQGRGNPILQGELPLDAQFKVHLEEGSAYGYVVERQVVQRAAPHQLPQQAGYPAQREFPTFEELNEGQVRPVGHMGHGTPLKTDGSYESHRRAIGVSG